MTDFLLLAIGAYAVLLGMLSRIRLGRLEARLRTLERSAAVRPLKTPEESVRTHG